MARTVAGSFLLVAIMLLPCSAGAEAALPDEREWTIRARAFFSGSSTHSEPDGYTVYSGIAVEAAVARSLGPWLAVELSIHSESREVDQAQASGPDARLGSLDLFPLTAMLQLYPFHGTWRPYAGAGVNLTVCWEKSGALDDTQVSPSVGPALEVGLDVALSEALLLNVDVRWNTLRLDLSRAGAQIARLEIDPLTVAAGVGVRL